MLLKLYKNAASGTSTGIKCVNALLMTSSCTSSLGKEPDNSTDYTVVIGS